MPTSEVAHCRATVAALSRWGDQDRPELLAARRNLRYAMAKDYLGRLREAVPPLTPEQLRELGDLLGGSRTIVKHVVEGFTPEEASRAGRPTG